MTSPSFNAGSRSAASVIAICAGLVILIRHHRPATERIVVAGLRLIDTRVDSSVKRFFVAEAGPIPAR